MSKVLVFGAGGRAGRAAVVEACRRGIEVKAAVRDPAKYADLAADGVEVVAGDVTDPAEVARLAEGNDAVIAAVYDGNADQAAFFAAAARALVEGLMKAGVDRLVWVGLASTLGTESGALLMDTPGYPQQYRSFYLAHAAGAEVLAESELDWLVIAPAGDFEHAHPDRTGSYRAAPGEAASRISYADFGIALVDEAVAARHHRTRLGVEAG
ncbi:MAG TPA: NAD(P)H-binding protein [Kribbella sp.]|nr:NAD(P)H-binding protein [Kribbella sp.]